MLLKNQSIFVQPLALECRGFRARSSPVRPSQLAHYLSRVERASQSHVVVDSLRPRSERAIHIGSILVNALRSLALLYFVILAKRRKKGTDQQREKIVMPTKLNPKTPNSKLDT